MDRQEATEALKLLQKVISQARDDTALQNWGMIQICHGVTTTVGFVITNAFYWQGRTDVWTYFPLWTVIQVINLIAILILRPKQGTRSFVENQINAIWATFLAAVILLVLVAHLMGLNVTHLGPPVAILFAVGFSGMGAIIERWFLLPALLFAAASLLMAWIPEWQYVMLGVLVCGNHFFSGVLLHKEKLRRLADGEVSRIV